MLSIEIRGRDILMLVTLGHIVIKINYFIHVLLVLQWRSLGIDVSQIGCVWGWVWVFGLVCWIIWNVLIVVAFIKLIKTKYFIYAYFL